MARLMTRSGSQLPAVLVLAALLAESGATTASVPGPVLQEASRSVVRVKADSCAGKTRQASGFVVADDRVITALHAVAGCGTISVYSESAGATRHASLARSLSSADLALLHVDDLPDLPSLRTVDERPPLSTDLVALGYHLGAPTMSSTHLKVAFGSSLLQDMLNQGAVEEIRRNGMPSLKLEILRLEGHLVPGLSGAPIIDAEGRLAAVGDGGLEGGAASISWALPVENLPLLEQSGEALSQQIVSAASLFSAELNATAGSDAVLCGDLSFTNMRRRSYSDLRQSTDDPASEQFLSAVVEGIDIDPNGFEYDIYVNAESGATVAVPAGMRLRPSGSGCVASREDSGLSLEMSASSGVDVQAASERFEMAASGNLYWEPDPVYSYLTPMSRWDGLLVNRKAFYGYDADDEALAWGMAQPVAYGFETLAARGDVFLGVVVKNLHYADLLADNLAACGWDPTLAHCQRIERDFETWLALVLGAFLSTFPIG